VVVSFEGSETLENWIYGAASAHPPRALLQSVTRLQMPMIPDVHSLLAAHTWL